MTYPQIIEKRNLLMHEAGTLAQSKNADAETRAKVKGILDQVDVLNEDANVAKRIEDHDAEMRSATAPPRTALANTNDVLQEKRAFRDWMRTGTISAENRTYLQTVETRDLGVGAIAAPITGGNVLVPVGFDPQFNIAQKSFGQIVAAVRNFRTDGGNPIRVSLADDSQNVFALTPEATPAAISDPNLSGFVSNTDTLTTMLRVTNQLLQDSAFSVDDFIQNIFAARYYRSLSLAVAQGNGSNIQKLTPAKYVTAATGGATAITYNNVVDLYAALEPSYIETSSFVCNSTVKANLMKLVDTVGRPILQTDATGVPFNSLFGRPFVTSQGMDNMTASKTSLLFGDLAASYTLRLAGPLTIARSTERYFELGETAYLGGIRVGGYNTSQASAPSLVGFTQSAT